MTNSVILETGRLILRPFCAGDFEAVHAYASIEENVIYMPWGPNTPEQTLDFLGRCEQFWLADPVCNHEFAVVLKESGAVIGGCGFSLDPSRREAMIGWILHRDWWKKSIMPEAGEAVLEYGFATLGLHRVYALCDAENYGSYRVMEKLGMRREGRSVKNRLFTRRGTEEWHDRLYYAILKEDWEIKREIAYYNSLPVSFEGFPDFPVFSGERVRLTLSERRPAIPEKQYVPAYVFDITLGGERIGEVNLRVGYTDGLYYGGQIGYGVDANFRGNGYAAEAVALLGPVMAAHGMKKALITCEVNNASSRRVCEKLGARFIRTAPLPEWHDLYKEGQREVNIYEFCV